VIHQNSPDEYHVIETVMTPAVPATYAISRINEFSSPARQIT
jgi:hypothetical protein